MKKPTNKQSKPTVNPNKEFLDKLTKDFGIPKYDKGLIDDGFNSPVKKDKKK